MAQTSSQENLVQYYETESEYNITIKKSKLGGRGLFACRPIKQGALIFANKPLVVGPRADCTAVFCSVCYKMSDMCYPCEKCQLYICSEECRLSQDHVESCNFIAENWKFSNKNEAEVCDLLIYLRFLLLSENKKNLLNNYQKEKNQNFDSELKVLEKSIYEIPKDQITFINMVHSLLKVNSFRISKNTENNKVPLRGFFPLSAFLNHSCLPNTRNIFREDCEMAVYATKDIATGEEILTCYTGLLWCTPARRIQLYKTKQFWCTCIRCQDKTEMGTNLSALKCLEKNCVGVLLPIQPTNPGTDWTCDMCNSNVSSEQISSIHCMLGSLVGTLDLDDQFRLETLVLERLAKFVPYSNQIFVDLRLRLAMKLGFADGLKLNELSESRLSLKENLCRGTLRTLAALGVGDAHLRGLVLYHLHAALAERARRYPDLYEELKSEIENCIEQAYHILQGDLSAPPDLELRYRYLGPGCDKPQEEKFFILDK